MQCTPPEKDITIEQKTPETLNLKTFYCREEKRKNHRYFVQVKQSVKNIKKIRQKKNEKSKSIKQVPLHPRDRLARKVQNITSDNDITFIKQVSLHPHDRSKCLTKDINDDMSTINCVDNDVNIDDLSDAETVNYTATPKKRHNAIISVQNQKKYKNLKRKIN